MPTNNTLPYSLSFFKPGARMWEQVQECENTGARVWEHFTAAWYVLHFCTIPTPLCLSTPLCLFCTAAPYIKRKSPPELLFRWAYHLVFHTLLIIYTLLIIHTSLSSSSPPIKTAKTSKPDGKIIKWNCSFGCFFYALEGENWKCGMRRKLGGYWQQQR